MKYKFSLAAVFAAFFILPSLSACQSIAVDPCSKAGIEQRLGKSLSQFARNNRADLNEIRQATSWLGGDTVNGNMKLAFALQALNNLARNFKKKVVPELSGIQNQCGADAPIKEVFIDFLKDEGIDKRVIEWVDNINLSFS